MNSEHADTLVTRRHRHTHTRARSSIQTNKEQKLEHAQNHIQRERVPESDARSVYPTVSKHCGTSNKLSRLMWFNRKPQLPDSQHDNVMQWLGSEGLSVGQFRETDPRNIWDRLALLEPSQNFSPGGSVVSVEM